MPRASGSGLTAAVAEGVQQGARLVEIRGAFHDLGELGLGLVEAPERHERLGARQPAKHGGAAPQHVVDLGERGLALTRRLVRPSRRGPSPGPPLRAPDRTPGRRLSPQRHARRRRRLA